MIGQIYLFEEHIPEAQSRRLAEYFKHYYASTFNFSSNTTDVTTLTKEIECIRKQVKSPQRKFELPGQPPVFMDPNEVSKLKEDMDEAWKQMCYVEKEELKWIWMQGVPGLGLQPTDPDAIMPAGDAISPPPYVMVAGHNKYPAA